MIYLEGLYEIGPATGGLRQTRCCGLVAPDGLGTQLVGLGQASVRAGPAHSDAKWNKTFVKPLVWYLSRSIDGTATVESA